MENKLYRKVFAVLRRLPEIQKQLRRLSGEIDQKKTAE
jgi:hypothetical protein